MNCAKEDDDVGGDEDDEDHVDGDDNDVHRSHADASPQAASKTCHPLQILFRKIRFEILFEILFRKLQGLFRSASSSCRDDVLGLVRTQHHLDIYNFEKYVLLK